MNGTWLALNGMHTTACLETCDKEHKLALSFQDYL